MVGQSFFRVGRHAEHHFPKRYLCHDCPENVAGIDVYKRFNYYQMLNKRRPKAAFKLRSFCVYS